MPPRGIDELRDEQEVLAKLSDTDLLRMLKDEEIRSILCDIDSDSALQRRLRSELESGWKARIRPGTELTRDTSPGGRAPGFPEVKRTITVAIDKIFLGFRDDDRVLEARMQWAGSGGYWREVLLRDVELIRPEA